MEQKVDLQPIKQLAKREFSNVNNDNAINHLYYGIVVKKFKNKFVGEEKKTILYILEDDAEYLQWLSQKKQFNKTRISLFDIIDILEPPAEKTNDNQLQELRLTIQTQKKQLNLQFNSPLQKEEFWQGLQLCFEHAKKIHLEQSKYDSFRMLAETLFARADDNGDKTLDVNELHEILIKLQITIKKKDMNKFLGDFDSNKDSKISLDEFEVMLQNYFKQPAIQNIYQQYSNQVRMVNLSSTQGTMSIANYIQFCREENQDIITEEEVKSIIMQKFNSNKQNQHITESTIKYLTLQLFQNIMMSNGNSIFNPEKQTVYQNMSRPLTDYYINSSHNTYLLDNQLTGTSSLQAYKNAFQFGCKCIELDCWDGSDGQPIVTHGHTLTSKLKFCDIVDVINQYGFIFSPYPIIISIENHCSAEQTQKLANILQLTIGFRLYRIPQNYFEFDHYKSPHDLMYKVIVKTTAKMDLIKNFAPIDNQSKNFKDDETWNHLFRTKSQNVLQKDLQSKLMHQKSVNNKTLERQTSLEEQSDININEVYNKEIVTSLEQLDMIMVQTPVAQNSVDILEKLDIHHITSCIGGSKFNLDKLSDRTIWEISSLDEDKIENLFKNKQKQIVDFHKKYFTRIYPRGTRIDSSNYDPTEFAFNTGAQICALNCQTIDFNYFLNFCKFQENGGKYCGYVQKPTWLSSQCINSIYPDDFKQPIKKLILTIISAQQLITENETENKETVDPYITVQIKGLKVDVDNNKIQKTITVSNNCINPQFNNQQMVFNICCPDLALLIFQVYDDNYMKDNVIMWYGLPFNCIRTGYRVVPLLDKKLNQVEHSYIFVHVKIL